MSRKMTMACTTMYGPYLKSDYKKVPKLLFLLTIGASCRTMYLQFLILYFQAWDAIYVLKWVHRKQDSHTSFSSSPCSISVMPNRAHTCPHSYKLSFKLFISGYRLPVWITYPLLESHFHCRITKRKTVSLKNHTHTHIYIALKGNLQYKVT